MLSALSQQRDTISTSKSTMTHVKSRHGEAVRMAMDTSGDRHLFGNSDFTTMKKRKKARDLHDENE
jgi:hypothetical protein